MLFNSFEFLFLFLPIVIGVAYWLDRRSRRGFVVWLVLASIVFYGISNLEFLWILIASLIVNYVLGTVILAAAGWRRRTYLIAGLVWNIGLLAYFKYFNFLAETFVAASGSQLQWVHVVLPVGISFFTFQKIAFLVDAYRGKVASRSFIRFALFVLFFPQLIAGPILHHSEFIPQIDEKRRKHLENLAIGLVVLTAGLFKKLYIADTASIPANEVFDAVAAGVTPSFAEAWFGTLAYSVQIYFDFSGYSDMAIGLARMLGFNLPINFASPYQARSIVDFWRRWHITLSRFLRDYLYIPLGGNRHGWFSREMNLMITMALGGIWHGAAWTFLLWGILHGLYLVVSHAFSALPGAERIRAAPGWRHIARTLTFLAVVVAWVPFRAATWDATARIWTAMIDPAVPGALRIGLATATYIIPVGLALMLAFAAPNLYQLLAPYKVGLPSPGYPATEPEQLRHLPHWRFSPMHGVCLGVVLAALVIKINDISPFIYFRF